MKDFPQHSESEANAQPATSSVSSTVQSQSVNPSVNPSRAYKGSVSGLKGMISNRLSEGLATVASSVASRIDRKVEDVARKNVGTSSLPISSLYPCPEQPRQVFEPQALEELAQTMRELGQAQAITVRKTEKGFEIISGERRFRAAKLAGFTHMDCVVKDCSDKEARLLALVENMQREDLLPIEEAFYLQKILQENPEMTLEKLAQRIGSHKSTLSEKIKLTEVPEDLHGLLHSRGRSFTHRHWRVVSRIQDESFRRTMLVQALENGLSVSELERSLKAAGVAKSSRRKNLSQEQGQMDLRSSGGKRWEGDFKVFTSGGGAVRLHAATLIPSELSEGQVEQLCGQLDQLKALLQKQST